MATEEAQIQENRSNHAKKLCPHFGKPCIKEECWSYKESAEEQAEQGLIQDPDGPEGKQKYAYTGKVLKSLIVACEQRVFRTMVMAENVVKGKKAVETDEGVEIVNA